MKLLPSEFVNYARYSGVSSQRIEALIGSELMEFKLSDVEDVRLELPLVDELTLDNWKLLEDPSVVLKFRNIARRTVLSEAGLCYDTKSDKLTTLGITTFNSVDFNAFNSLESFVSEITKKFELYESIDQERRFLQNLSAEEFFVIVALLELFIEKYPNPDSEWLPDELLVFSLESLLEIISDSDERIEDQTWWQHWKRLTESSVPETEELETALLMLAHKQLIGVFGEIEGKDLYYVGQELLWMIRGLVWWDRGFALENKSNHTQLYVFEASALFALIVENESNYSLYNIEGKQLSKLVMNYFEMDTEAGFTEDEEIVESAQRIINFCPNCGVPVLPGGNFCTNCGYKLV